MLAMLHLFIVRMCSDCCAAPWGQERARDLFSLIHETISIFVRCMVMHVVHAHTRVLFERRMLPETNLPSGWSNHCCQFFCLNSLYMLEGDAHFWMSDVFVYAARFDQ